MSNKYNEIFEQKLEETDGDALAKFAAASHAMRLALIKDVPVWMKFNAVSWMIPHDVDDKDIDWEKINELLKTEDEYDFNAFDYIDSKLKFAHAAGDSKIAGMKEFNQPFVRRTCKCGEVFTLTVGQVQFYCKHEWPLPKKCPKCLAIKNGKKIEEPKQDKTYTPGFGGPLNGMAAALQKAGLEIKEKTIE